MSKAAFVGANTVTGSGPDSLSTNPAALIAVTKVENVGLTASVSKTVQVSPQVPGGIWNLQFFYIKKAPLKHFYYCSVGGAAGRGGRKGPGGPRPRPNAVPRGPKGNCGSASASGSLREEVMMVAITSRDFIMYVMTVCSGWYL